MELEQASIRQLREQIKKLRKARRVAIRRQECTAKRKKFDRLVRYARDTHKGCWVTVNGTPQRMTYREYLDSPQWELKRQDKFNEVGRQCESCGREGLVNVHHLSYLRLGCEDLHDLRVLCRACHERMHTDFSKIDSTERSA